MPTTRLIRAHSLALYHRFSDAAEQFDTAETLTDEWDAIMRMHHALLGWVALVHGTLDGHKGIVRNMARHAWTEVTGLSGDDLHTSHKAHADALQRHKWGLLRDTAHALYPGRDFTLTQWTEVRVMLWGEDWRDATDKPPCAGSRHRPGDTDGDGDDTEYRCMDCDGRITWAGPSLHNWVLADN